ncbi:hypothetical protein FPOAC1_004604 [Fusarium poae]|uniref:hypothetical protein n=1 Tax=Fusarium poae TaxID=36050 RepID=UPI001CE982AA|nr:hypothetical protein FPOAC1_004604 [Fusarium poae]KAG8671357.1 hypothetical protein FPOAC1_004604 [Fusarium poae]
MLKGFCKGAERDETGTLGDTCILSQVKLQCKGQRLMQPRGCNVHVSLSWTLTRLQHFCNEYWPSKTGSKKIFKSY